MSKTVGIDLGTTYSLVASVTETGIRIYSTEMGRRSTASVVQINGSGITVGYEAKHSAALFPDRTFAFFKRDMGVPDASRTVDGHSWTPAALSAEVLKSLLSDVERETGERPRGAVITVPAYFGDASRRAVLEAAEIAGVEVLELIQEPTAAALAFGFDAARRAAGTVLVYDLGGGTFDVSLVRIGADEMEVIATDGDHELGGKDWDDVLIGIVADRFEERHAIDPRWDPVAAADLRERCEDAKRALSRTPATSVSVLSDGVADRIPVTREEFEGLTAPLLARTAGLVNEVLATAGLDWGDIGAAVLVGGSTRMPGCSELLSRMSGREPTRGIDPDTAVVHGAALLATRHSEAPTRLPPRSDHRRDVEATAAASGRASAADLGRLPAVRDVTAHALGFVVINAAGDRYENEVMIARNARLPARAVKSKLLAAGVADLDVYVLQGHQERPLATEPLGRYRFSRVPGIERDRVVEVAFRYDTDGIVAVSAAVGGVTLRDPERDFTDRDLSWTDASPRDHGRSSLDVALLIDCSGSMSGASMAEAQDACAAFARSVVGLPGARVGLVSFASSARVESSLSEDAATVARAASSMIASGGTDLEAGLRTAAQIFDRADGRRVIVVLTDGEPRDRGQAHGAARRCRDAGLEIVTVGVTGADMEFLESISTTTQDAIFTDDMRGALHSIARFLAGGMTRKM